MKQVESKHYDFNSYETPERFTSYFYQVRAVLRFSPTSVLEIGTGSGVFSSVMRAQAIPTYTIDIDPKLGPSICGSALNLPFKDECVDVSTAFQVLEHLPFENFDRAIAEMARVARKGVVISLPEYGNMGVAIALPFVRKIRLAGRTLLFWRPRHRFDGEHYWELNKRGFPLRSVMARLNTPTLELEDSWLNPYNPYHRFFLLRKRQES